MFLRLSSIGQALAEDTAIDPRWRRFPECAQTRGLLVLPGLSLGRAAFNFYARSAYTRISCQGCAAGFEHGSACRVGGGNSPE
jgi:hypothetical protein